jgi:SSS family solute:Na+ symporter
MRAATEASEIRYEQRVEEFETQLAAWRQNQVGPRPQEPVRPGMGHLQFLTYLFIPLSVAMFPHLFQHKLTAKSAQSFKLVVVAHPLLIMLVWFPCVLLGVWATSAVKQDGTLWVPPTMNPNAVLAFMVSKMADPTLAGLLTAGILAAIMSSLDSQFLCISSMFTNDIVGHHISHDRMTDRQRVMTGRIFVVVIVVITYLLSVLAPQMNVFPLAVWCFSGFAAMFPLILAALYWRRVTKAGALACVLTTAGCWLWMFIDADYGANREYLLWGMMPVAVITAASTGALVLVSLITAPPTSATVAKFFPARAAR